MKARLPAFSPPQHRQMEAVVPALREGKPSFAADAVTVAALMGDVEAGRCAIAADLHTLKILE